MPAPPKNSMLPIICREDFVGLMVVGLCLKSEAGKYRCDISAVGSASVS